MKERDGPGVATFLNFVLVWGHTPGVLEISRFEKLEDGLFGATRTLATVSIPTARQPTKKDIDWIAREVAPAMEKQAADPDSGRLEYTYNPRREERLQLVGARFQAITRIVAGRRVRLTREQVIRDLKDVQPDRITTHAVLIGGVRYPVKQPYSIATESHPLDFTTQQAVLAFRKLGFELFTNERERS